MTTGRRNAQRILCEATSEGQCSGVIDCCQEGVRTYTAQLISRGGDCTATVNFAGSTVDTCGFENIGDIELVSSDTTNDSGSFPGEVPWNYIKVTVTKMTGNGCANAWVGV